MERDQISKDDIDVLVNILASQAESSSDPKDFFKEIINSAGLPNEWLRDIEVKGSSNQFSRVLINWAWNKGINSKDPKFHTLGSILCVLLDKVGLDISVAIVILIVRYELYVDANLLKELKENKDYLEQLRKNGCIEDFDSFVSTSYLNNNFTSITDIAWKELREILKKIIDSEEEDKFYIIKEACRKTLPKSVRRWALTINEVEQVLKLLEDYPPRNGIPRIAEFAFYLANEDIDLEIQIQIAKWCKDYHFQKPTISHPKISSPPQPRLFIWIEEKHNSVKQNQFSAQAWLIPDLPWIITDQNIVRETYQSGEYYTLDFSYLFTFFKDEISKSVSYELLEKISRNEEIVDGAIKIDQLAFCLEELQELFSLFLNEALILLYEEIGDSGSKELDTSELTAEIFLPEKILYISDIDQWTFFNVLKKDNQQKPYVVGTSFKVILRSLERSTKRQEKKSRREAKKAQILKFAEEQPWKLKWKLVMDKLELSPNADDFELLHQIHELNDENLQIQLEKKIGVILGQSYVKNEILRRVINDQGIPIVLWTRCNDEPTVHHASEMNKLVHSIPSLICLPEYVRNKRRETLSNNCSKNHLGFHLVMLWDDPNRFPPNAEQKRLV